MNFLSGDEALARGAYEAVLAGDTREERDLLVSMFTAREPQG